ncbi:MAG TPA: TolC family protein [Thermoanaerobaculia bacterium]|nr:TolC family protein [Thermoanaerobaculia bacterium]
MRRYLLLLAVLMGGAAASSAQEAPSAPLPATPAAAPQATSGAPADAASGGRALSLAEALQLAEQAAETIRAAEADVARAEALRRQARSELFPQLGATGSYSRTLHSEFEDVSLDFGGEGGDLSDLPFGQANQYRLGLLVNQNVWSGGRIAAQTRAAAAGVSAALTGVDATRAELALDVTQAYFDAQLLDRLVTISEATLAQADRAFELTRLAREVGNQSEFEQLRAQVTRDNERPRLLRRRAERDFSYARLTQLLGLPADEPLDLTTNFADFALWEARGAVPTTAERAAWLQRLVEERAPVRQAVAAVAVREQEVKIARAERLPSVGVTSDYGRVAYPIGGLPAWADTRTNWTVGLGLRLPLLTGGRLAAQEGAARAILDEAQARLDRTRELAWLDARDALDRLATAEAVFQAAFGTISQAQRAYEIAELRYREGLSTQLELNDTRIQLTFAQGNAALAARNLQVSRARVALLPDLPLGSGANALLDADAAGAGITTSASAAAAAGVLTASTPGAF